ncbi:hypothetical protein AB7C87_13320 [Natrarchaeobius sp. A-rgal3]|uniref:hypothetical protein n=1 Tax=Natrarchaeobius versutus TaxID=1679078 RepID=UPI0035101498
MRLEASFYGFVTRETTRWGMTDGPRPVSRVEPSAGDDDASRRVRSSGPRSLEAYPRVPADLSIHQ